jgi:Dienelactone hydrolase and related enzymes
MLTFQNRSDSAIIVLHEIYGINWHMREVCREYAAAGYDVCCPDLLAGRTFDYAQQQDAYEFFMKTAGFEVYSSINDLIRQLRPKYRKIILLGFSAGATVAWRCAESGLCDGMIGCYGSRIRDYTELKPKCPTLLIFADQEIFFDAAGLASELKSKPNVTAVLLSGNHGFCDPFSAGYNPVSAAEAKELIIKFLTAI